MHKMQQQKTSPFLAAAMLLMLGTALLSACKKDNNTGPDTVSEEEAAEAITQAVAANSGGIAVQASDAAVMADTYIFVPCGSSKDTAISRSSLPGALITYNASAQWHWTLTCPPGSRFDYQYRGAVNYDAPRMSSNDSLNSTLSITGLDANVAAYTLNINLTRNGSQQSKILRRHSFTSTIVFSGTDIKVDKGSRLVQSGTATVVISGAGSGGRSFQYSGTLVFTGNKTASLTLGSGASYDIQW